MVDFWKDQDKPADMYEVEYEYQTEEESIFKSFQQEIKNLSPGISKIFSLRGESFSNKKIASDMLTRFTEKTETNEFLIKFNINVEKTNESTISMDGNAPGEVVDQKERRRFIRKEMREFRNQSEMKTFSQTYNSIEDKNLFTHLLNVFTKAN